MFGRRILRETDYEALQIALHERNTLIQLLHTQIAALHERLITAEGVRASASTMRDLLVTRVNVLEEESAVLRHKVTGLPQIAPKIEKGSPLQSGTMGAQVDLFEDVGDVKARELSDAGLLHAADVTPDAGWPSARDLTEHLQ